MNKKCLPVGIILLFIGTAIIPSTAQNIEKSSSASRGHWLYVGGSGPGNYSRIQEAINASSEGDTVFVYSGTYKENIVINHPISLIGENKHTTIIDGMAHDEVVYIKNNVNGVKIQQFTIHNCSKAGPYYADIHIEYYSNNTIISDNIFYNDATGVLLHLSNYGSLINNTFDNCSYDGIHFVECHANDVSYNIISKCDNGIFLEAECSSNNIHGNILDSNSCGIYADGTWGGGSSNNIYDNLIENNKWGIYLYLAFHNNFIQNNMVIKNRDGISLDGVYDNTVQNNSVFINGVGILLIGGARTLIIRNNITQNSHIVRFTGGVFIVDSSGNNIIQNNFVRNIPQATFLCTKAEASSNQWLGNYWGKHMIFPKLILGRIGNFFTVIPWIQFDFHPAQVPYDVPGMR